MVDELEFDLDVDVSHCIMVYAIQRSKKIYYCKNNEKQDSYRESYFYIRPIRNVNSANSFIDGGLYTSLLSKTFFGRYEYEQFVEALEMKYLVFVRSKEEFETLKSAKEVFETKYQMPMYVEGGN